MWLIRNEASYLVSIHWSASKLDKFGYKSPRPAPGDLPLKVIKVCSRAGWSKLYGLATVGHKNVLRSLSRMERGWGARALRHMLESDEMPLPDDISSVSSFISSLDFV